MNGLPRGPIGSIPSLQPIFHLVAALGMVVAMTQQACASGLPPAVYSQQVQACRDSTLCKKKTVAAKGYVGLRDFGPAGEAKLRVSTTVGSGVKVYTRTAASNAGSAMVAASVTYYVQVTGPSAVAVPLIAKFTSALTSFSDGSGATYDQAGAAMKVYINGSGTARQLSAIGCPKTAACKSATKKYAVSVTASTHAAPQSPSEVVVSVQSVVNPAQQGGTAAVGTATVNCKITIDPSFADASAYKLTFSPGVTGS